MLSLKKLDEAENQKKQDKKIERELPYFITLVSLLASSGLGPYTILQKIKEINLLPIIRAETVKILKRIDMLGIDPLTALSQAKDKPSSRALGEFLGGYVSAIQSGGNVINFLKSKMSSSYERLEATEKQSVEKLSGVVHAWLTMQIVILAVFILVAAIGSNPLSAADGGNNSSQPPYLLLIFSPIISIAFMKMVQKMNSANIQELSIKNILKFMLPPFLIGIVLMQSGIFSNYNANAYILGTSLAIGSLLPAFRFQKIYTSNLHAEAATPQILRDITEARKAGMGPEKCIIHACKRKDFKSFNLISNTIANKLEWGIPLSNIFETLQKDIKNFQVLVSFRILFEIISSGGGNVNTLDSLADASEKIREITKTKRDMLQPYVMVGFMLITITGFTTLLTIDSFSDINKEKNHYQLTNAQGSGQTTNLLDMVSVAIIAQAWLAGLFIGKITKGAYSGGFMYSMLLTVISMVAIGMIQLHVINMGAFLPHSQ